MTKRLGANQVAVWEIDEETDEVVGTDHYTNWSRE